MLSKPKKYLETPSQKGLNVIFRRHCESYGKKMLLKLDSRENERSHVSSYLIKKMKMIFLFVAIVHA